MDLEQTLTHGLHGSSTLDWAMTALNETSTGGSAPTLHITHQKDGLMMATFGPVCIAVWHAQPTPDSFEVQRAHLATAVLADPGRAFFLCVVSSSAPPPEQAVRDASASMITGHGVKLAGCACVIEGSGFRAAITRTVLSGIALFIRSPSPVTFFESVASACFWLDKRAGRNVSRGLASALEQARVEFVSK